jgi:peptidoglycan/LPS O-acetylase OafA/YrhL
LSQLLAGEHSARVFALALFGKLKGPEFADLPPIMSSLALPITLQETASTFRLGHRPALDGVRGLAIVLVIIHHVYHMVPWSHTVISGGYLGVDLFFVLSGFLITSLIIEEHANTGSVNLARFYMRRALRLLPAVAAALIVAIVVGLLLGFAWIGMTPLRFASIVGYFTNWVRAYESGEVWFLSHFWSLAIEEQFYLIWPAFLIGLLSLPRRAALFIATAIAIGSAVLMGAMFLSGSEAQRIYTGSDTRAYQLLSGCVAAMALHWGYLPTWLNEKNRAALAKASLVFLALMFLRVRDAYAAMYLGVYALITLCATMLIVHVTLDQSRITSWFEHRTLVWFGKRSYGLYVWHFPIYFLIAKVGSPWLAPFGVAFAIGVAAISYQYIETPFLRLKSRYAVRQF